MGDFPGICTTQLHNTKSKIGVFVGGFLAYARKFTISITKSFSPFALFVEPAWLTSKRYKRFWPTGQTISYCWRNGRFQFLGHNWATNADDWTNQFMCASNAFSFWATHERKTFGYFIVNTDLGYHLQKKKKFIDIFVSNFLRYFFIFLGIFQRFIGFFVGTYFTVSKTIGNSSVVTDTASFRCAWGSLLKILGFVIHFFLSFVWVSVLVL